ncbi:damage-inducible protein DinB [Undibacterium terreum]|uniref:Damage-inducible protein DinB n=2 Tax=Undibacterium terreum TaxID=1224302 RepID=A0A916UC08_9BURK|nr:damage-inducible protein DinB [Undibacterium terreum]
MMAYNNAWANYRLLKACTQLSPQEFVAPRTSFFPTIRATLGHILTVDWFYMDALERELRGQAPNLECRSFFENREPFDTAAEMQREQALTDNRMIAYCKQQNDSGLNRLVSIESPGRKTRCDTRTRLLAHIFQHQIHHRGQVHAMLSGTSVAPPQLDDFFCSNDAEHRADDFAELGWTEADVWNPPA